MKKKDVMPSDSIFPTLDDSLLGAICVLWAPVTQYILKRIFMNWSLLLFGTILICIPPHWRGEFIRYGEYQPSGLMSKAKQYVSLQECCTCLLRRVSQSTCSSSQGSRGGKEAVD